ncbi:MAG TPA: tryptophan synthase subunit alpha [Mariprofundaceae bacterium]|nr:tryptophan synthase subunit alpha [Mariprofundaceae bacterium]
MSDRLSRLFSHCKDKSRAALVGYLTAGDPDVATSEKLIMDLAGQVDVLEIGMPFSDPMADGPVIQAASERALAAGAHISDVFGIANKVRAAYPDIGIILMGYANVPYTIGFESFAQQASDAGVDGVLIVDIPAEESYICEEALQKHGLHRILLLSPTSSDRRIKLASEAASGFIYYVSLTGITGAEMGETTAVAKQVENIRNFSDLPICVGFGVKTAEQAKSVAAFSDGVVVGSHFVSQIPGHINNREDMLSALHSAASSMRGAMEKSAV